jgi:predicted regulator of amino acid metabolism with ACT domain
MPAKNPLKNIFPLICVTFLLVSPWVVARGAAEDNKAWKEIETKYTIIRYQDLKDLKKFNRKVKYPLGESGLTWLFSGGGSVNLTDKLKKKVDATYRRVQEILDMRKRMKKVTINIYQNKKQLRSVYYKIYMKECRIRAWYIYEYNTIYISVDDLHEGMLAHELAHSIIDHYLTVRPPPATSEILARYVDSHLFR